MLPRKQRIESGQFSLFKGARFLHTPHFLFRYKPLPSASVARAAVVVSTTTYKKAVDRNRIKRRTYAVLEQPLKTFPPLLLSVTVKPKALTLSTAVLREEVLQALEKLKPADRLAKSS